MRAARRTAVFTIVLIVLCVFFAPFKGRGEDTRGKKFYKDVPYKVSKSFETVPLTFEAVISLPADHQGRGGVIIGNFSGASNCLSFEIFSGGNPRIYYIDGEGNTLDIVFKNVDVRGGDPVHIAIVNDSGSGRYLCYKNGEQADSIDGAVPFGELSVGNAMWVGGDGRSGNSEYFKGRISKITLYDRARTPEQVGFDAAEHSLLLNALMALDFRDGDNKTSFKDLSGNGYDAEAAVKWLDESPQLLDYEFSLCLVGDTQKISMRNPRHVSYIYDWICENIESKKIAFVMHMGDITENSWKSEWDLQREHIFKLNGKVGYSMIRGNHDTAEGFCETFGVSEYMDMLSGTFEGDPLNSYQTFTAGGQDFLQISLDYGASDDVLRWAAAVIEAHPDHLVIISTHCYLYHDGTTLDIHDPVPPNYTGSNDGWANNGDQMWDKLMSKYPNIFLVCCGHDPWNDVVVVKQQGENGNTVTSVLANPQDIDLYEGSSGIVTMLYFSRDGKRLQIENYSTIRGKYYAGSPQKTVEMPGFPAYPPKYVNVEVRAGGHLRQYTENEKDGADDGNAESLPETVPGNLPEGVVTVKVPFGKSMGKIVLTAEEGFCIPEDFEDISSEGVTATREGPDSIVISGTPQWHVSLTLGDAEPHTPLSAVRENETDADCEHEGSYDSVIYCERCGKEVSKEHVTVPAKGHSFGDYVQTKPVTCTENGEEQRVCEECGHTETRVVETQGHFILFYKGTPATEEAPGFEDYERCIKCGYSTYREIPRIEKTGPENDRPVAVDDAETDDSENRAPENADGIWNGYQDQVFAADKLRPDTGIREIAESEDREDDAEDNAENEKRKRGATG